VGHVRDSELELARWNLGFPLLGVGNVSGRQVHAQNLPAGLGQEQRQRAGSAAAVKDLLTAGRSFGHEAVHAGQQGIQQATVRRPIV
jgi:hypothetical protein